MTTITKPARSVDWTKDRIAALATPDVKQLRANAVRLNDPEITQRCDDVLEERPRHGERALRIRLPVPGEAADRAAAEDFLCDEQAWPPEEERQAPGPARERPARLPGRAPVRRAARRNREIGTRLIRRGAPLP